MTKRVIPSTALCPDPELKRFIDAVIVPALLEHLHDPRSRPSPHDRRDFPKTEANA